MRPVSRRLACALVAAAWAFAPAAAHAAPDLACTVTADPDPASGEVAFTVTVTNDGDSTASPNTTLPFAALFADLPSEPNPEQDSATTDWQGQVIPAGGTLVFEHTSELSPGSYTAWCMVNPDVFGNRAVADETVFGNNVDSVTYSVAQPQPDIVVTEVSGEALSPTEYVFTVTAKNQGGAASGAFFVDVYAGFESEPEYDLLADSPIYCSFDGLAPGAEVTLQCEGSYTDYLPEDAGVQSVWAYADRQQEIANEADTTNNSAEGTVTVIGPPDPTIVELEVVSDGAAVSYLITVGNEGGSEASGLEVCVYYHSVDPPNASVTPSAVQVISVAEGEEAPLQLDRTSPGGEYVVWVMLDCRGQIDEIDEENNLASQIYEVDAPPNVAPVLDAIDGDTVCTEAKPCSWTGTASDSPGDVLTWRVLDGPVGMWANPQIGEIRYVPPLGSSAVGVVATIAVVDAVGATDTRELTFDILPNDEFEGVVGPLYSMTTVPGFGLCPMVEVPGNGFAYVNRGAYSVRFFQSPTASSPATKVIPLAPIHPVSNNTLSCHVAARPGGGFALFEMNTGAVLLFGNDFALERKVELPVSGVYGEQFVHVGGSTWAFLRFVAEEVGDLVFVDFASGALDPNWGGNAGATPGAGTPGILKPHHDPSFVPYDSYLWTDGSVVRVFNRYFDHETLNDYAPDGSLVRTVSIGDLLPEDLANSRLMAAPDGGVQILDRTTATLQWYESAPVFDEEDPPAVIGYELKPMTKFTLPDPDYEGPGPWPTGWVSVAAHGLSVTNLDCAVLAAGGFSCRDRVEGRGYVLDRFGDPWDLCNIRLDVSPPALNFGGVPPNTQKTLPLQLTNLGGGVVAVDQLGPIVLNSGDGGAFSFVPLPGSPTLLYPGQRLTAQVTYQPNKPGFSQGTMEVQSNLCQPLFVSLTGYSGARLQVTPSAISFDAVGPGIHKRTLTITSVGSTAVNAGVTGLSGPPHFSMDPPVMPSQALAPGEFRTFEITFDGNNRGSFTGEVTVTSNAPSQGTIKVPLTAVTAARPRPRPAGYNFGATDSTKTELVEVFNLGHSPMTFTSAKVTGPAGFVLDGLALPSTVAPGESLKVSLRYTALNPGTVTAVVTLDHDAAGIPPVRLQAVAGRGTRLPEGFAGTLPIGSTLGGPFESPLDLGAMIQLTTGGFAAWSETMQAIVVVDSTGQANPWFGVGGVISMSGPDGAFPGASGLGDSLVELRDGGFGMLSVADHMIYTVRPDGTPHPYIGVDGVIDLDVAFSTIEELAPRLVQQPKNGAFAVIDTGASREQIRIVTREVAPTTQPGNGLISFLGPDAPGEGDATGIGDSLAVLSTGTYILGDTATKRFYQVSDIGALSGQSTQNVAPVFQGRLARCSDGLLLFYDPATGGVTAHNPPNMAKDPSFGAINADAAWAGLDLGESITCGGAGSWLAVTDLDNDALRFVDKQGQPLALRADLSGDIPLDLDFGIVPVGTTSAPSTITLQNDGQYPLTVKAVFSTGQFHLAAVNGAVPSQVVIPPGETGALQVVFEPKHAAQHGATMTVHANDPDFTSATVALLGSTGGHLVVTPNVSVLDFGNVAPGASSLTRSLTFANDGADPITLTKPVVDSSTPGVFETGIIPNTGPLQPGGAGKGLELTFSPPAPGIYYGSVTIQHTDASQPTRVITLVGRSGGQLAVTPSPIACPGLKPGVKSICSVVTLHNVGSAPLQVFDVAAIGSGLEASTVSGTLTPSGIGLEVMVLATPSNVGPFSGTLRVVHDDPLSGGLTTVPIIGSGAGSARLSPASLDFGGVPIGGEIVLPVTVYAPAGSGSVKLLAATTSGDPAFSVAAIPETPATINAANPATIQVRCRPTTHDERTGTLSVITDSPSAPVVTATLRCVGGGVLFASPSALDFGGVPTNESRTLPVTITNGGAAPVVIGSLKVEGTGFTATSLPKTTLAPGASVQAVVTFAPPQQQSYSGTLLVMPESGSKALEAVSLSGHSGPSLTLMTAGDPLDFGVRAVGSETRRTVLLVNSGTVLATIDSVTAGGEPFFVDSVDEVDLEPGEVMPIEVTFEPHTLGRWSHTLTISPFPDSGFPVLEAGLTGRSGGFLRVSPTSLSFGQVATNASRTQGLRLSNTSPSQAIHVEMLQSGAKAFALNGMPQDGVTIPPGGAIENLSVTFLPQAVGDFTGTLTFTTDKGVQDGSVDVALSGRSGSRPTLLAPNPAFLGFEGVPVTTSAERQVRVGATSGASFRILGFSVAGDAAPFTMDGLATLPLEVPAGDVVDLTVICTPPAAGIYEGTLFIATDDPTTPTLPVDVYCSTPPAAEVEPAALEFGAVAAATEETLSFVVRNEGPTPLALEAPVLEGDELIGFALDAAEAVSVAAQGEHTFSVTFTPPDVGVYEGAVRLATSDPARPEIVVPLSGVVGARLQVSPPVAVLCNGAGSRQLQVTNVGSAGADITAVSFATEPDAGLSAALVDGLGSPLALPLSLAPGESRVLQVDFDGGLGGASVAGAEVLITSSEVEGPERAVRVIAGDGLSFPDGFVGRLDVGPPGGDAAFPNAENITGVAELCTGGAVVSSAGDAALHYAWPAPDGGAEVLQAWGRDAGTTTLASIREAAGLSGPVADDFGAKVRSLGDLTAISSPSAGAWVLVHGDGSVATEHPTGGVIRLADYGLTRPVAGDIAVRPGGGLLLSDVSGPRIVALTANGALDASFGTAGVIDLTQTFTQAARGAGDSIVPIQSGIFAVSDPRQRRIYVLKGDGNAETSYGQNDGILDFNPGEEKVFPNGVAAMGPVARVAPGFAVVDRTRGQVLFTVASGGVNATVGSTGIVQVTGDHGLYPGPAALGGGAFLTSAPAADDPAQHAGRLVLITPESGDLVMVEPNGSSQTEGLAALGVRCPINILNAQLSSTASATVLLRNTGSPGSQLRVESVTRSGDVPLTCQGLLGDPSWSCEPGDTGGTLLTTTTTNDGFTLGWAVGDEAGCYEGEVQITHTGGDGVTPSANGPVTTCPVNLGTIGRASITPATIESTYEFPPTAIGGSFEREFVLRNEGCGPVVVSGIDLPASEHLTLDPGTNGSSLPATLGPGDIYRFSVTCAPKANGEHQLSVGFDVQPVLGELAVTCRTGPRIQLSHAKLDYFGVTPGESLERELVLSNTGGAELNVTLHDGAPVEIVDIASVEGVPEGHSQEELAGAFRWVMGPFDPVIPAGQSRKVKIAFSPPWAGEFTARLRVTSDTYAPANGVVEVPLSGLSAPCPVFVPEPVDFTTEVGVLPVGTPGTVDVMVTNAGAGTLVMEPIPASLEGTVFSLSSTDEIQIQPGAETTLPITCTPSAAERFEATLQFESPGTCNAIEDRVHLDLVCEGGNCATIEGAEMEGALDIDFGTVVWDEEPPTRDFTLTNGSESPISVTMTVDDGQFTIVGEKALEIVAGGTETVTVRLTPAQLEREVTGLLTITSPTCVSERRVSLRADVVAPEGNVEEDPGADAGGTTGGDAGALDPDATGGGDDLGGTGGGTGDDGGGDGCGCDMTPSKGRDLPSGAPLAILAALLLLARWRRPASSFRGGLRPPPGPASGATRRGQLR